MSVKRAAVVMGMVSMGLFALAPTANASWEGSLNHARVNYESARWQDENYSQITWYGCSDDVDLSGNPDAFSAQIWEDISLEPDESYDNKTFTACFHGERSNGEWTDLPSGKKSYYFQIMDIHYSHDSAHWLNVTKYIQDTTKAD